jgi:P-type Ca2+ transporter type 2C
LFAITHEFAHESATRESEHLATNNVAKNRFFMIAHNLAPDDVAAQLSVNPEAGLSSALAQERLAHDGPNRLAEVAARSAWSVLFAQFKGLVIIILIGAALLAAVIGSYKDAVVILAVVVINAFVGFYQEYRAERSLEALKSMLPVKARVRRDGEPQEISADSVVAGDVLLLEAGDNVAADGRLTLAVGMEVDESALTGESMPVGKETDVVAAVDAALGDRINMVYMNTLVTRGRAELVVTATGIHTEMGHLSQELETKDEMPSPLQIQLDKLAKRFGVIALTMVALLSLLQYLRGVKLTEIMLDAIALSVAAMPEGLPVVVTVTLALGMQQMARQNAIVKRLASVETLGCTTVICSDKTGTLTLNQMTVRTFICANQPFEVSGEGYATQGEIAPSTGNSAEVDLAQLMIPIVACNDSHIQDGKVVGDPMEAALLVLAAKSGLEKEVVANKFPRLAELPFDSKHKYMATFHSNSEDQNDSDAVMVFVKGAPDVLIAHCRQERISGIDQALTDARKQQLHAAYEDFGQRGLRGLLVAMRTIHKSAFDANGELNPWINELSFVGLIGLQDPPRAEATQAIAECQQAGIAVKMITGDHQTTASAIASELGLHGRALSGADLDCMDAVQLASAIDDVTVFARVSPAHKVKIVRALQTKGHVVAMTGDGVNDAPALKQADIGVAMGINGTAVAKEAATMVLTDDNFATIVIAVKQGRVLYDNILKFVRFQMSTTIGAILTIFFAPFFGLPEPFTALQILWVAIIMDGPPAVSLALDSARPNIMNEPPRQRDEPILPFSRLVRIFAYGVTMMVGTLSVLYYELQLGPKDRALTIAFTTFVLFQFFNVFNARSEKGTAFNAQFFQNRMLWTALIGTLLLQALAVHWPVASKIFGTTGMVWTDWGIAAGVASTVLFLEEGRKLSFRVFCKPLKPLTRIKMT